jgi:hypothetical protein
MKRTELEQLLIATTISIRNIFDRVGMRNSRIKKLTEVKKTLVGFSIAMPRYAKFADKGR